MPKITSEFTFEEHIEGVLTKQNGYLIALQKDYKQELCLRPDTLISFVRSTQTKNWKEYCDRSGNYEEAQNKFLKRVKEVIDKEGTLHVLRNGVSIIGGGKFDLCYFKPTSPHAEDSLRLYKENIFHVQRQLFYSADNRKSVDMVLFLNGMPIFTIEVKNEISGQNVWDAKKQFKEDRDPADSFLRFKRNLAFFALDNQLVYVTTKLQGEKTDFLPFNKGNCGGAGNPPSKTGYSTSYLWENIFSKESILDLIQRFIRVVEIFDDKGKKTGEQAQIFPRYHQLSCVRELTSDAAKKGAGHRYLNQHSAGSGKTNCIAWLANSLATLHGTGGDPVFSSVIVISDRRVIDRMLQRTLDQVIGTPGMLMNISSDEGMTSENLKNALLDGKRVVVTTLQKFGVIVENMNALPGEKFGVIIDEAHSSQTGEGARAVEKVLSYGSEKKKEDTEKDPEEPNLEELILEVIRRRSTHKNISYFAFTATPKPETLQQFGVKRPDGSFIAHTSYSMRQAIEEGFILDVLKNYSTYDQYYSLLKKVQDDPTFDSKKAKRLLKNFVSKHESTIDKKNRIMVDHFLSVVAARLDGKAKAMIVTSSRLHAVRYKLAVDKYLGALGCPFKAVVAFTGKVKDPMDGKEYTESGMNGFPEKDTADRFEGDEYRILIVASKFQVGFDQPKLTAMYVDKKLQGVNAVQTLSRLNRKFKNIKTETFVLDFENSAQDIEDAFQPFYDRIALNREVDPNLLYDIQNTLEKYAVFSKHDVDEFAKEWFSKTREIQNLHGKTNANAAAWFRLSEEDRVEFKSQLRDFIKLYSFLSNLIPFSDIYLEKLFLFLRFLLPKLITAGDSLPLSILNMVDIEKLAIRHKEKKSIGLKRGEEGVDPTLFGSGTHLSDDDIQALSRIIQDLNSRFNTSFTKDEILVIKALERKISEDEALQQQLRNGSQPAVRATFYQVAEEAFEKIIDENYKFYQKIKDDDEMSKEFFDKIFEWFLTTHKASKAVKGQTKKRKK